MVQLGGSGRRPARAFVLAACLAFPTLALGLAGCGDSNDSSSSCSEAKACGGDVVGVWRVTSICGDFSSASQPSNLPSECKEAFDAAARNVKLEPLGASVELTSDGHYQQNGKFDYSLTYRYTSACFQALAGVSPSAEVCAQLASALGESFKSASCKFGSSSCTCSVTSEIAFDGAGTYRTQNNQLFFDDDTEGTNYCVRGNTAKLSSKSESEGVYNMTVERTSSGTTG